MGVDDRKVQRVLPHRIDLPRREDRLHVILLDCFKERHGEARWQMEDLLPADGL